MRLSSFHIITISITISLVVLGILYGVFPNATASFIEGTLGVTGSTIVALAIYALGIFWVVILGFVIVRDVANRRLWITHFEAEILGPSHKYLGETIQLKASFKGELTHGLFTCKVQRPDKREEWWPAYRTLEHKGDRDVGVLSGRKMHECSWAFKIPVDYPAGTYTVYVQVCESPETGEKWFKQKAISLQMTSYKFYASGGTSSGDTIFLIQP
jgi:hypothetical protein